jgi:hypothetical protein
MAAYIHRLLKHLLSGISPEWRLTSFVTPTSNVRHEPYNGVGITSSSGAGMDSTSSAAWPRASTHEIIQENLYSSHTYPHAHPHATAADMREQGFQIEVHDSRYGVPAMQHHHHGEDMLFPADDDSFWYVIN